MKKKSSDLEMTFIIRKLNYVKTNKIRNMNQIVIHTNITKIITVVLLSKIQKQIQLCLYTVYCIIFVVFLRVLINVFCLFFQSECISLTVPPVCLNWCDSRAARCIPCT